ncbi:hypothetical protein PRUPE_8G020500 [Prunus persica]|uniref:Uncharacterized protein n=1 Tax=Prunus persica TaxID=3760 RepID=M5VPB7_PRUPE|nr:hypothetical protein PRUPE_8G020500 [Prunus persica]
MNSSALPFRGPLLLSLRKLLLAKNYGVTIEKSQPPSCLLNSSLKIFCSTSIQSKPYANVCYQDIKEEARVNKTKSPMRKGNI